MPRATWSPPWKTSRAVPVPWRSTTTLAQTYGSINLDAAKKGLEIYAEHTEDARANGGKHPNIDRLLQIEAGAPSLRVKHVFAV